MLHILCLLREITALAVFVHNHHPGIRPGYRIHRASLHAGRGQRDNHRFIFIRPCEIVGSDIGNGLVFVVFKIHIIFSGFWILHNIGVNGLNPLARIQKLRRSEGFKIFGIGVINGRVVLFFGRVRPIDHISARLRVINRLRRPRAVGVGKFPAEIADIQNRFVCPSNQVLRPPGHQRMVGSPPLFTAHIRSDNIKRAVLPF